MVDGVDVFGVELALDYEVFEAQALPASPHHKLRRTCFSLRERA